MDEPTAALSEPEIERAVRADPAACVPRVSAIIYISHRMQRGVRAGRPGHGAPRRPHASRPARWPRPTPTQLIGADGRPRGRRRCTRAGRTARRASRCSDVARPDRRDRRARRRPRRPRGEILGLAGLVGAGRTELAPRDLRRRPGRAGEVRVEGSRLRARRRQDAIARGVGLIPERPQARGAGARALGRGQPDLLARLGGTRFPAAGTCGRRGDGMRGCDDRAPAGRRRRPQQHRRPSRAATSRRS